jgi:uncharacterized RDD family membrane protein YckC
VDEVVIGEAVVLEVPFARFPSRMVALVIDLLVQSVLLVVAFVVTAASMAGGLDQASGAAVWLACFVLIIVGYPVIFETLTRGKSLGKMALGLRVVSDDGGPERFRQALVRALVGVLEIWLTVGFLALVTSLLSGKGKRLGDMLAGTFVIQDRLPGRTTLAVPLATMPPVLAGWASTLQLSGLTDATAETARSYLSRFYELTPAARWEFGERIAAAMQAQVSPVPPPGTWPADYLSAVLAERRAREHARMMAHGPSAAGPGTIAASQPLPTSQPLRDSQPPPGGQPPPGSQPPSREADDPGAGRPGAGGPGGFLPPV